MEGGLVEAQRNLCENPVPGSLPEGEVGMLSELKTGRQRSGSIVSVVLHAGLFGVILLDGHFGLRRVVTVPPVEIGKIAVRGGSSRVELALPEMALAAHSRKPDQEADAPTKTAVAPKLKAPVKKSAGGAPPAPKHGDGSGPAETGSGDSANDAVPAFPIFSPHPPVSDRSLLPVSQQNIVVNVSVDAQGAVTGERLVKGLGNGLDQIVLDIVRQWRFQPATVDGKPVATEAELIFPFDQSYRNGV